MEFNEKSRDFFIKNMIDFITYLKNKGCKITIFPMQLDKGGFDNIITNEILKDFKPSDLVRHLTIILVSEYLT